MHRIDGATAAATLPAPAAVSGTPGYFTGGDPAVPTAPTVVDADWLNAIQEELAAVVLGAGLALAKANNGQLLAAIQALITSGGVSFASDAEAIAGALTTKAVTPHAAAALVTARVNAVLNGAPAALDTLKELADAIGDDPNFGASVTTALAARALAAQQITGAGLATGGGDLSTDRAITVTAASVAQVNAQTDATTVLTPANYGSAGGGDGSSGWAPLPGGNILQWGSLSVTGDGSSAKAFTIAFPKPFINICGSIVGNADIYSSAWHPLVVMFQAPTIAGVSGYIDSTDTGHGFSNAHVVRWQAIGR